MAEPPSRPSALVVGIGASAGGLDAFKRFLASTPADTGMAFVLVQHLDPHHKSLLVELLGAHSPIPVVVAKDGLAVKQNCVFVIPPDATLTIKYGVLRLTTPAPAREHRRPIDTFFTSLAEDCGERAVGIVLAGVGSDGTIGIRIIKEHGGLTLAQAQVDATAMQGMPSSAVATGRVDHVMPVEAMPGKLIDYQKHLINVADKKDGDGRRRDLHEHLERITSLLHARSEHDFSGYKEATLMRRVQRRMQVLHIDGAADYLERLRTDKGEVEALFHELLIGVTQFFRDPQTFEALERVAVLPMLSAKGEGEPIRIWVPGCSTGEEAYSIAMLLRETLLERHADREVTIFGTDIDANAVAIARAGRYRKETLGVSPERLERWFVPAGEDYCPVPEIRSMCVFSTHSVVKDPPFSRLNLISCRNVLIYLEEELQDLLMRTFHYALLPGGYLFLGTAESVARNSRLFTALDKKNRILQRRDASGALPAFRSKDMPAPMLPSPPPRRRPAEDRIDKAVARVMQHYAPAYFVIDRNHEITRFSGGETGHYLEPSAGAPSLNLFSILHKALRPAVRAAVSQALADGVRIVNDNLTMRIDGEARALTLIVEPIGGEEGAKSSAACVVAFRDTSPATAPPKTPQVGSEANVEALENELRATKAQLEAATDELETRTEDMKSTTEDFHAINEELQSSNEELETSKEELQSVNEELQTINSELNNKNEQLTRLNADMQNLLDSTQIATVFLDDELRIRHFTPTLSQLFPVKDSDRGRPLTQIVGDVDYTTLQADVQRVQRNGEVLERDLALKNRSRNFVMRIRPYYRIAQNVPAGVVITFVHISERKRAEQQLLLSRELQHRTNNLLAVIQSIAGQSLSGIHSQAEEREAFTGPPACAR
jgi:two-component system, chemotaxis family, CheB/CheR fusion protein